MPNQPPLIFIASDGLSAQIDPLGAQLFALKDAAGADLLWGGDPAVWAGRAPILFPIVGTLAEGRYRLGDGSTYALPRHGFARHRPFEVQDASPTAAIFRLRADDDTLKVYPFRFELDIRFAIAGRTLNLTATVKNEGQAPMPASFGFHPAFRRPLPYGGAKSDHRIAFDLDEPAPIRRIDPEGLLKPEPLDTPVVGRVLALRDDLFMDDALIFDRLNSQALIYGAKDGPSLRIAFPKAPYLGVWSKPGADFIAIEPWRGVSDPEGFDGDIFAKPGVFTVAPGGAAEMAMSITLEP